MPEVLVATEEGLRGPGGDPLDGRPARGLIAEGDQWWAIVDGRTVMTGTVGGDATAVGSAPKGTELWCVAPRPDGSVLAGSTGARLWKVADGAAEAIESFDAIEGRDGWYTPWGDPPDTRSITLADGQLLVNVHVGGVWESPGLDGPWQQVVDVDDDVHQVVATSGGYAVAAAVGLAQSGDGRSWSWTTEGLHAPYCRAVAITDGHVLVTASTGPRTDRAAVYRRPLHGDASLERCHHGLPDWFEANLDTFRLAAAGATVALGAKEGSVWISGDEGGSWEPYAKGLPDITAVAITT